MKALPLFYLILIAAYSPKGVQSNVYSFSPNRPVFPVNYLAVRFQTTQIPSMLPFEASAVPNKASAASGSFEQGAGWFRPVFNWYQLVRTGQNLQVFNLGKLCKDLIFTLDAYTSSFSFLILL